MILTVVLVGSLVTAAVLIHYEMLYRLASLVPKKAARHRYHVLVGVLGSFCAHVIEVWVFAFGYYFMVNSGVFGSLQGNFNNTLRDCSYFSFTTYSTLGVGDIEPVGHIRFLVGLESLTGLVLITWTASFVFVEMQKFWENK
jgi:hypothetical protein